MEINADADADAVRRQEFSSVSSKGPSGSLPLRRLKTITLETLSSISCNDLACSEALLSCLLQ